MSETKVIIPVVMSVDNNYAWIAKCALFSLLENRDRNTGYHIFLLKDSSLTEQNRQQLLELKKNFPQQDIEFIPVEQGRFQNARITTAHLTTAAYYRLFIGELLPWLERCIYLDCDVLVLGDLMELWETALGDNYIGAVKNWNFQQKTEYMENRRKLLKLPSMDQYINSGVLLLNLKQIRSEHLTARFERHMEKGYPSEDQDVLNVCCYGKICFLPLKFNMYNRYTGKTERLSGCIYSDRERKEAEKQPVIIHFAGGVTKPWNNVRCLWAEEWWGLAGEMSDKDVYDRRYGAACEKSTENDLESLFSFCRGKKNLFIYGYTELGKKVFRILKRQGTKITGFCDRDSTKQKESLEGTAVVDILQALSEYGSDLAVINVCQKAGQQVGTELTRQGIREEDIYNYNEGSFRKSSTYYVSLAPAWYEREIEQICLAEELQKPDGLSFQDWLLKEPLTAERLKEKYLLDYWILPPYKIV